MKGKDIQIGEVYAMGAPGRSRRNRFRLMRVRVTGTFKTGVIRATWHNYRDDRKIWVEFEPMPEKEDRDSGHRYQMEVREDTDNYYAGQRFLTMEERAAIKKIKVKKVYRCLSAHILKPWIHFEAERAEHEEMEASVEREKEARQDLGASIADCFTDLGFESAQSRSYGVELNFEDCERIQKIITEFNSNG